MAFSLMQACRFHGHTDESDHENSNEPCGCQSRMRLNITVLRWNCACIHLSKEWLISNDLQSARTNRPRHVQLQPCYWSTDSPWPFPFISFTTINRRRFSAPRAYNHLLSSFGAKYNWMGRSIRGILGKGWISFKTQGTYLLCIFNGQYLLPFS